LVDSAIFFLVGFLSAALLALLATPAISRRAFRLAAARARLQSPLSETQARAERDALRGQHAVEVVRLERRLGAIEDDRATGKAQIGRQADRILQLQEDLAANAEEIVRQREEIAALHREAVELRAHQGAQEIGLRDLASQRDAAEGNHVQLLKRANELETQFDENRAVVATLETRATRLEVELSKARRSAVDVARAAEAEHARLSSALAQSTAAVTRLTADLEAARAKYVELSTLLEARGQEIAPLRERVGQLEPLLARSESTREELALENGRQLARIAELDKALQRAEAARRDLDEKIAAQAEAARDAESALAKQIHIVTTAHSAMDGALSATRADRDSLHAEIEALRGRLAESAAAAEAIAKGDFTLRQSIVRLGREIARGQGQTEEDPPAAAQVVTFSRREPSLAIESTAAGPSRHEPPLASEG
jgi:chromosome segregation ATPase